MKTVIIGGGKGCRSLIDLTTGTLLSELTIDVVAVMDIDVNAPGMVYAREHDIDTITDLHTALAIEGLQLVIELTGDNSVLEELYKLLPPGVRLIDHEFTHLFWDLINAQDQLAEQLREKEELQRKLWLERRFLYDVFDTLEDLVIVLDRDKRVTRANASFIRFVNAPSYNAVLGKTCVDLLAQTELSCDDPVATECDLEKIFQTGVEQTLVRHTPPPHESHWEIIRQPLRSREGEITGILATWHKITDQILLKREVESAVQRFKSLVDAAHDMISIKDLEGRYILVNPITAETFHMKPDDFLGKTASELLPPETAQVVEMDDRKVLRSGEHMTFAETYVIDGMDKHFNTVRFPLRDYKGEISGICSIARDLSKEHELQQQLVQTTKLAALGNLAAGVAHEINNPLTGILAYAEDLLEDPPDDPDDFQEDMSVIIRETKRCRDIVRNLLDFSRQDKPRFEEISPNRVVDQVIPLVEKLPQFRDIQIEKHPAHAPPLVRCDPRQLQQVMLNFMTNAAEAMNGKGKILLRTRYSRRRNECIISVEDNGPGIPENLVDKIFDPFFSTKGTNGLGLAVSWGIIERHGGTVEVDMSDNGGAIFNIMLPALDNSRTSPQTVGS